MNVAGYEIRVKRRGLAEILVALSGTTCGLGVGLAVGVVVG